MFAYIQITLHFNNSEAFLKAIKNKTKLLLVYNRLTVLIKRNELHSDKLYSISEAIILDFSNMRKQNFTLNFYIKDVAYVH